MKVNCVLSIDWEGNTLLDENIQAMQNFSKKYPQVQKVQFLNAAYVFNLSDQFSREEISSAIRRALGPNDEFGLHIHPWQKLVESAGVTYRNQPSYKDGGPSRPLNGLYGGDVPLTAYERDELAQLIDFSLETLKDLGFEGIRYFRGGGWVSSSEIFQLLYERGISYDSSAVPSYMLSALYPNTPLQRLAEQNWSGVTIHSDPYRTEPVWQCPNNVGLADYIDQDEAFEIFKKIVEKENEKETGYFHYGWHQETCRYLPRVDKALELITDHCQKEKIELSFPKLSECVGS